MKLEQIQQAIFDTLAVVNNFEQGLDTDRVKYEQAKTKLTEFFALKKVELKKIGVDHLYTADEQLHPIYPNEIIHALIRLRSLYEASYAASGTTLSYDNWLIGLLKELQNKTGE